MAGDGWENSPATRRLTITAWAVWAALALGVCGLSAHTGFKRTVVPAYREASVAWVTGRPIYELDSIHGFLYLPSAAALGVPFTALPKNAHEIAFRTLAIAFLACGVRRLSRHIGATIRRDAFLGMTLIIAPVAIGSAMAGQMNLAVAAVSALAAADMCASRWNSSRTGWSRSGRQCRTCMRSRIPMPCVRSTCRPSSC